MKKEYNKVQDSGEPEYNLSQHGRMPSLGYSSTTPTQDETRHTTTEQEQEHGDKSITFGLRRADTENGKWVTTANSESESETTPAGWNSNCSSAEVRKELEDRMYRSRIFRMWMRVVMAGVFAASGYAISVVTTA